MIFLCLFTGINVGTKTSEKRPKLLKIGRSDSECRAPISNRNVSEKKSKDLLLR